MKLNFILENISRKDFFDFYSLEYAYSRYKDPEIERNLEFLAGHILNDHLDQFADILLDRLPDMENAEVLKVMYKYNVTMDPDSYKLIGVDKLSFKEKFFIISELVRIGRHHGFTGETWFGLGHAFLELAKMGSSRKSKILAIDKLYNLLHHGGMIVDYMDENDWLEDALHIRDNANPAQLFSLSSPRIRALIGRSSYSGMINKPVDDMAKIYTALRRASRNPGININRSNNELIVTVDFQPLIYKGGNLNWSAIGGKIDPQHKKLVENGDITIGDKLRGEISIKDGGNAFIISAGGNSVNVKKPINRQYSLAKDMIQAAISVSKGRKLQIGHGISSIKPSYYYRNGLPVRDNST